MQFIFACPRTHGTSSFTKRTRNIRKWFLFKIRLGWSCCAPLTKELLTAAKSKRKLVLLARILSQNWGTVKKRDKINKQLFKHTPAIFICSEFYVFSLIFFELCNLNMAQNWQKKVLKDIPSLRQSSAFSLSLNVFFGTNTKFKSKEQLNERPSLPLLRCKENRLRQKDFLYSLCLKIQFQLKFSNVKNRFNL